MRRRQMMQKVSRISLGVVVGLLFLALIWKFAGAQLAKKGIVLSNDTAAKTVSETAPEAEDGSGNAGIKKLAETTPPNETPGWQYSSSGWWYATDATTYYVNGWADIDGNQYHFDSNGYMATGWKAIGGKGCYFDDQGVYQPDRNGSMMVALTFDDGPDVYTGSFSIRWSSMARRRRSLCSEATLRNTAQTPFRVWRRLAASWETTPIRTRI